MPTDNASFSFSFSDGSMKIEGSELFVSEQVEIFREKILDSLSGLGLAAIAPSPFSHSSNDSSPFAEHKDDPRSGDVYDAGPSPDTNPYPRVLDVMGDKLKITTTMKGKNTAEKAVNLILAYLWGKERLLNEPTAEYRELRELCAEHACLDSGNFSSTLTAKKSLILVDGSKGSSSKLCKLTYPGREAAEEVLSKLNEPSK